MNRRYVRDVALEVLERVERKQSYSNIELNGVLRQTELSRKDVSLVTELVYGTLQRRNTLDWFLEPFIRKGLDRLDIWVRELLRMSVYQIKYLQKIPPGAAVNEAVEIAKRRGRRGVSNFVNAVLRNVLRHEEDRCISDVRHTATRISLKYSHPKWLVERWLQQWDENVVCHICEKNNRPPLSAIRVNKLKMSRTQLKQQLVKDQQGAAVRFSEVSPLGLVVTKYGNMADTTLYREGVFSIQDESSMLVGDVLDPTPGASVLDMCAAPGGKTTHLAELLNGEGSVDAYDIHEHKVDLINKQAKRLGLHNVKAEQMDARQLPQRITKVYDYVLLDAPCSGFGVIRRKPEIKWRKSLTDVGALVQLQRQLLTAASQLVKPGGVLVYSTCTLEQRENEKQVSWFLDRYPMYRLSKTWPPNVPADVVSKAQLAPGMLRIFPHYFNSDGFFIARMVRRR